MAVLFAWFGRFVFFGVLAIAACYGLTFAWIWLRMFLAFCTWQFCGY